jgi:Na+/H+ antiporter NhaD/arsenite permease-like protein
VRASANGLDEKTGYPISFKKYLVYAIPITIETLLNIKYLSWLR